MKTTRKIIEIDDELCDGCGQCVPSCAEGALQIVGGKARVVSENLCDGLGACMGECPNGALKIIEREADEFDEDAVEQYLETLHEKETEKPAMACGCPSQQIRSFTTDSACACLGDESVAAADLHSRLLPGKVVMMGCPKFDDIEEYTARFREIFTKAAIHSVTVVSMEVPCCAGLAWVVKKAMEAANADIPLTEIIISGQGRIVSEKKS